MLNNLLLSALLLAGGSAGAGEPPPEPNEYFSKNKAYSCRMAAADARGEGGAGLIVRDAKGSVLGKFRLARVPYMVTVSDDGKRLVVLYASYGHLVTFYGIAFHSSDGKLLKEYSFNHTGPVAEEFSADGTSYAFAFNNGEQSGLDLYDLRTGARNWHREFKTKLNALKMSADGKWFAAVFINGERSWRAALLDAAGAEAWGRDIKTRNNCYPSSISADGAKFTIAENRMVYSEADGYYHDTLIRKTFYSNKDGSVSELRAETVKKN